MQGLRLYLLGTPQLVLNGTPVHIARQKALALGAYLALASYPHSRDSVAALLWPDQDSSRGRSSLRSALTALTTPAPQPWIVADRQTVAVDDAHVWVDGRAFTDLLAGVAAHNHVRDTLCETCVERLHDAVALYRADFMQGFQLPDSAEFDDWQLMQREALRREYAEAHRRLAQYYTDARAYDLAIEHARGWLAVDRLHEPAHRQLMRLYAATGQRAEALRQYKQCVEILDAELAATPEAETTQIYDAILLKQFLGHEPRKDAEPPRPGVLPPRPPLVVGRDHVMANLRNRIGIGVSDGASVTVIQGWPGVGKSTTVALLAHDDVMREQFPDGVLWASLGETPDVFGELVTWAEALGLGAGQTARVDILSAQLAGALRDRRVLLIVDDVWQAEHALPFRVGGQGCALVMTTRLNDVAVAIAPTAADVYRLPVLSVDSGLELLRKLAPDTLRSSPAEARELIEDLEGLPLAILVAGRLLQSEARLGWGVRELLDELRAGAALLAAQPPSDMIGRDTSPTIAALLKRSTDLLDDETRQRFALLGLFVPKPATFDLEAMSVAWDVEDPRPAARTLVNRGLLEPIAGGRFQMHAVLVMHARTLLAGQGSVL